MDRRTGPADSTGVPQDRPVRGSLAELRFRLERLPAGHPSSPYDDQGARKAAPQQLRQLELPLADEERESESPARASLLAATAGDHDGAVGRPRPGSGQDEEHSKTAGPVTAIPPDHERGRAVAASEEITAAPEWITSQNGVAQPDGSPARGSLPGSTPVSPYPGQAGAGDVARGNGVRTRDGAAGAGDLLRRTGTDPYDFQPAGHEVPAGRADLTDAFRSDWRDHGTGGPNGHSRDDQGTGDLDGPALPADAAAEPGTAERDAAAADGPLADHAAAGQHSLLTPEQEEIANQALGRYRAADGRNVFGGYGESGLTPAIRRVEAHLPHGRLAPDSEEYTLKSPERYKAKLARMIARSPAVPAADLAAEIYDAARYTFVFEPQDYTDGTWLVHRRLKAQGFELEARRNRWESPEYKGIRTRWRDPAHDLAFEVQFHTPASWDVLRRTHDAFLRITDPLTPTAERAQLRARQVSAAAATRSPARCAEIGDFRADVR